MDALTEKPESPAEFPEKIKDDLQKSGISVEEAEKKDWCVFTHPSEQQFNVLVNFCPHNIASIKHVLFIPYYNKNKQLIYWRVKPYPSAGDMKYLAPKGEPIHLYISLKDWEKINSPKTKLFVVEGEKKALKLAIELGRMDAFQFSVIGVSGITCWDVEEWKDIHLLGRDAYIVFDADGEDNGDIRREELKLYAFLTNKGAKVKSLAWNKIEGKGIDDWLVRWDNPKRLETLINDAGDTIQKYGERPYAEIVDAIRRIPLDEETVGSIAGKIKKYVSDTQKIPVPSIRKAIKTTGKGSQNLSTGSQSKDALLLCVNLNAGQPQVLPFKNEANELWVKFSNEDHWECHPLKSGSTEGYFRKQFYTAFDYGINKDVLTNTLENFEAMWPGDLQTHNINLRVARQGTDALFYDLCDPKWRAIKVTPQGWEIVNDPPVFFKRLQHQQPQITPIKEGDLMAILRFIPVKDDDSIILLLVWLLVSFVAELPHPILVFYGSQGTAKSTTNRFLRSIIDPSITMLLALTNDPRELVRELSHHYFAPYDNLTTVSNDVCDILCRAVTGEGSTKRALYTNDEDVIYRYRRCISLNGINCVARRPDLLERSILIELQGIRPEERKEESELWAEFEKEKPGILGSIFNALSAMLRIYPTLDLKELPRMADFTRWGYAAAEALGDGGGKLFLQAYKNNMEIQNAQVLIEDPVAACAIAIVDQNGNIEQDPTTFKKTFDTKAGELDIDIKGKDWPRTAALLTRRLNTLETNLYDGKRIVFQRARGNTRMNRLYKEAK